jgi:hypothetical protein
MDSRPMTIRAQIPAAAYDRPTVREITQAEGDQLMGRDGAAHPLDGPPLPNLAKLAVLTAGLLLIDDARIYGLIDAGPDVDRERCHDLLRRAEGYGIVPDADEAEAAALSLMAELGVLRP